MKVTQFSGVETLVVAAIFGATIDSRKKANYDKYYSQSCAWLLRGPNGLTTPNNTSGFAPISPYWIELVTKDLRMNYKGSILPRLMSKTPSRLLARRPSVSMASSKPLQGWPSLTVFSLRMLGMFFLEWLRAGFHWWFNCFHWWFNFMNNIFFFSYPWDKGPPMIEAKWCINDHQCNTSFHPDPRWALHAFSAVPPPAAGEEQMPDGVVSSEGLCR